MIFDLKKAPIVNALEIEQILPIKFLHFWRVLFLAFGTLAFVVIGLSTLAGLVGFSFVNSYELFWGVALIMFPLGGSLYCIEIFSRQYLRYPKISNPENLAERLDLNAAQVMARTLSLARMRGEAEATPDTLLIAILSDPDTKDISSRLSFDGLALADTIQGKDGGRSVLRRLSYMAGLRSVNVSNELLALLVTADEIRQKHAQEVPSDQDERITSLDLLTALFKHDQAFKKFMLDLGLDEHDLSSLSSWYEHIRAFQLHRSEFWTLDNLLRKPPIGKDWIYGYSQYLNHFAVDLTEKFSGLSEPFRLTSRKKEIDQIEQVLSRAGENNVLLVGEEGVGKNHIVEEFAEHIAKGQALPALNYKKVFRLNLSMITASSKESSEVQNMLVRVMDEAVAAGNVILVIEGLHNFVGAVEGMGRVDVTEIILPYLRSSRFQVLATTDPVSFHKHIESRPAMMDVFEKVTVQEPDLKQTAKIVQESLPAIEYRTKTFVSYGALKAILESCDKYIRSTPFPEKAFNLLSEVIAYASAQHQPMVMAPDVHEVVSRKTGIPLGPIVGQEKEKLLNLETLMRQQLVGQERAISVVAATMRRLRTGMSRRGKPAGVFLFIGPTGVGKTETAKILARVYYGAEDKMLRFDMSEYQELESMDRFIGSLRLNEPGQFTTLARDNPFSLILLDELEKANKNLLNLFLQVFDEAHLTDAFGRSVSFEQHIIIATSNAGADLIRDLVQQGADPSIEKEKIMDVLIKGNYFRPEFLNRFDEVVIFNPLTQEQVGRVAEMALNALAKRLQDQDYIFKVTPEIASAIATAGFDPQFGARPIQRAVKDKVENAIAKKILDGAIQKGQEFSLTLEDLS